MARRERADASRIPDHTLAALDTDFVKMAWAFFHANEQGVERRDHRLANVQAYSVHP
jgi:hypothetical protein